MTRIQKNDYKYPLIFAQVSLTTRNSNVGIRLNNQTQKFSMSTRENIIIQNIISQSKNSTFRSSGSNLKSFQKSSYNETRKKMHKFKQETSIYPLIQ